MWNLKCSFCCWDEAGQKPGVSNERYAKLSMVCQDTDSAGSLALSPCHILSFTVGTQLPCATFSQSPAVPLCPQYFSFTCALPHLVCPPISTPSLDRSSTWYHTVSQHPNGAHERLEEAPLEIFPSFYYHQPPGQMLHPHRNMTTKEQIGSEVQSLFIMLQCTSRSGCADTGSSDTDIRGSQSDREMRQHSTMSVVSSSSFNTKPITSAPLQPLV